MRIYNSMTRKKEELVPINPGEVKIYTCGQTVYNDIHMGNARFYVVYDAARKHLERKGYKVAFVQNFTDIDDKIIAKANQEGCSAGEVADRYVARARHDLRALGVGDATASPRVTEEMDAIVGMISALLDKGFAYEAGGTVYFAVEKFGGYGKLSRRNIGELEAGKRIEVEPGKKCPHDFVLWKPAKDGEPSAPSPWGPGRPGWHIECSAMARKYLGDEIDIHGGGEDLLFPHHENEIAQSEAATGKPLARIWMHCGMLTQGHRKMSKSRGDFFTVREVLQKFPPDVVRFFLLSGHYRMPMEFSEALIESAAAGLGRIKNCAENLKLFRDYGERALPEDEILSFGRRFDASMDDDFNTADAISVIFELVKYANQSMAGGDKPARESVALMRLELCGLAGGIGLALASEAAGDARADAEEERAIEMLVRDREAAKRNKDYAGADRIRAELAGMGVAVEDTRQGPRWKLRGRENWEILLKH